MVAIIKIVVTAALLSQASAAALVKRLDLLPHLRVDEPVLATPTEDVVLPTPTADLEDTTSSSETSMPDIALPDGELKRKRQVVSTAPLSTSSVVPASVSQVVNGAVLEVGDPVLAVRPGTKVRPNRIKSTSTIANSVSSTSVVVEATGILGKLIVGDPVLAIRTTSIVSSATTLVRTTVRTTLTTSVVQARLSVTTTATITTTTKKVLV